METSFDRVILGFGTKTGIEVPAARRHELGADNRPPVVVTVAGYSFRSTVGVMSGRTLISLAKAHREASGHSADDAESVTLVLDAGSHDVEVPPQLQTALDDAELAGRFFGLAHSTRKEFARQVAKANTDNTRDRRVAKILDLCLSAATLRRPDAETPPHVVPLGLGCAKGRSDAKWSRIVSNVDAGGTVRIRTCSWSPLKPCDVCGDSTPPRVQALPRSGRTRVALQARPVRSSVARGVGRSTGRVEASAHRSQPLAGDTGTSSRSGDLRHAAGPTAAATAMNR